MNAVVDRNPGKKGRKFNDFLTYEDKTFNQYYLLPFRFIALNPRREILVNEIGDFLIVDKGTAEKIILKQLDSLADYELYNDLIANFFISKDKIPVLIDVLATRYRTKKSFLDHFTALHIFVITLRCEHTCHYCQVSRVSEDKNSFDMSKRHIDKGIELMMQSPNPHVTMEFQGGEALLAFDHIKYGVEKAKLAALTHNKEITFVICTNLAPITTEMLLYCKENSILISTSLDGPEFIHNKNRHKKGNDSHQLALKGIKLTREILGNDRVSALLTTSALSLDFPNEIVDEYFKLNFGSMFLRPISPFGFATRNEKKNKYNTDRFIEFYKKGLNRIINYNLNGSSFREDYATILLKKILTPFPVGYVDLQSPAGMINNVIVFNYDGKIYASDEARMLAEMSDFTFQLGHLDTSTYNEIFYSDLAVDITEAGINESLPGCSDCAFQTYCGADPVLCHSTQGNMYGHRPTNVFCQKNMAIIKHLFELMDSDPKILKLFNNWVRGN
ncbi:MAG: His-Xaa-Ser system radical SAM maturase HxsB [Candidatus Pedobacter colombiensis]|uniref:His-Xaa-Ser system radical SAM maturase HxsB n=1 Tax=Candidatus Pedobacter colombiensis TaxID=3121371 RepID=A0AAJ5WDM1_9SPHI|nr:His-Xaa-Ser system radical SAM maturase HxsB [Pedobacter sp.]WEK21656.1 MAG: His-Xaa-Ser system radical SAM maturase HxsB [Pedobacter sp.]